MWKWIFGGFSTGGAIGLTIFLAFWGNAKPSTPALASEDPPATLVHLFEWTWPDIANECETFLGPNGYTAVQISPPQEHVVLPDANYPWWQRYQPVSYRLESRSGSRAELIDMVSRCHRAGVAIYADAVINHMAGVEGGVGSAGSEFTKYHYPGLYRPADFNDCRQPVSNYLDAANVTQCELVGLADLDTGSEYVRSRLAAYLNDLASVGIQGFRIDAAKHIRAAELGDILQQFTAAQGDTDFFIYQEVIDPGTEAIHKQDYYANGHVVDFEYGRQLGEAFWATDGHTLAQLETFGESWGLAPSDRAVVFVDNHDKQRGHGGGGTYLTHQDGQLYTLANVFMLAFPYGQPRVMSSYDFDTPDQGPPAFADGTTRPVYDHGAANCFDEWVCEHRWLPIANMVAFRQATQPVFEVTDWWSNGHNQIAFGRGELGFVVINREAAPLARQFQTQLPPGEYCNVIEGALNKDGTACQNHATVITVAADGSFFGNIQSMDALAIHVGAKLFSPISLQDAGPLSASIQESLRP
jgi:alpha-amylase